MAFGSQVYLWILVIIEVLIIGGFRNYFKSHHGG